MRLWVLREAPPGSPEALQEAARGAPLASCTGIQWPGRAERVDSETSGVDTVAHESGKGDGTPGAGGLRQP